MAIPDEVRAFADWLGEHPAGDHAQLLQKARLLAASKQDETGEVGPLIRTLEDYLAADIPVPPVLVHPFMCVRGGLNSTIGRSGKGKEQPHSAKILTPTGWTTMGEIEVGNVVVNPDGGAARVIGKFPQGVKPVYRVTFSDGATTEAGAEHLWSVSYRGKTQTVTTMELREKMSVPIAEPVDMPTEDYRPIDPWLVGFLLGDGSMMTSTVRFSTADSDIVERVKSLTPCQEVKHSQKYDYYIVGGTLGDEVRQLGMNCLSRSKRVPRQYMTGTAESRLEVLRGLMDADGHWSGQFSSMSKGLVEDVIKLTRSLGGAASLHAQRPNGAWRTVVQLPVSPFWLARKSERYVLRKPKRYVRSVEYVRDDVCSCIMLDSTNHLYVTDDYVVTHNTVMNLNRLLRWSAGVPWLNDLVDAEGMPVMFPDKALKVLIVENEGAAGMFHRQIGIMTHAEGYLTETERKLALKNVLIWKEGGYSNLKLDEEDKLNELRQGVEQHEPDLVYIEPLRSLWTGEENSSTDMNIVVDAMIGIASDFDCGVWVVHHEKKNSFDGEDKMSRARGSTVLENFVTVMENFEVKGDNEREVSWSKSRHGNAPNPVRLSWDKDGWWYNLVPTTQMEEKIISALRASPDQEPMSLAELSEETSETVEDLRPVANKMVDNNRVRALKSLPNPNGRGSTGKRYALKASEMDDNGGLSV